MIKEFYIIILFTEMADASAQTDVETSQQLRTGGSFETFNDLKNAVEKYGEATHALYILGDCKKV